MLKTVSCMVGNHSTSASRLLKRTFVTSTSYKPFPKPVLQWDHSDSAKTEQFKEPLPKGMFGLSPKKVALMRRLRNEAHRTYNDKRLARNFHIARSNVAKVAPWKHPVALARDAVKDAKRAKFPRDSVEVRQKRLANWWVKQYKDMEKHIALKAEYKQRARRAERDFDTSGAEASFERDLQADMKAERVRTEKRVNMASRKGK